ncbi:MAG: MFS transporter [Alphaproteobacteria bacterium]|tara:strand:- start:865 stop:2097 length:1233 start_codon:yes stop_codon:yes gene_type:complete
MLTSCFKNQTFRYLWTAGCFTGIARAMEFLTLSLYILNDFGLAYLITVIFAFRMLPMSMLGLIIGSISEKISPILIVRFLYSLSFSFTFICVLLKNFDYFNLFFALLLAFINGTTWVIDLAVRRRIITENITEKLLSTSLAMETLSNNSTRLIGPLLAGFLYVAIDLEGLLLLISSLYFLALGLIICFEKISINFNASLASKKDIVYELISVFKSLKTIIFDAFKDINLKLLLIVTLIFNLFGFPLISLIPVYGKNNLNLNEAEIGFLASSEGVGALIGALIIAKISPQKRLSIFFLIGCIGFFLGMLLFSISSSLIISFLFLCLGGMCLSGFSTMQGALTFRSANKGKRGYNFGILVTCIGLAPISMIIISFIIDLVGVEQVIRLNAIIALALLIFIAYLINQKKFKVF